MRDTHRTQLVLAGACMLAAPYMWAVCMPEQVVDSTLEVDNRQLALAEHESSHPPNRLRSDVVVLHRRLPFRIRTIVGTSVSHPRSQAAGKHTTEIACALSW